jgi:hypothetical protein
MPTVGGALVLFMALHGMFIRSFLEILHAIYARVTYSRDPVFNFATFWKTMRDRYAFMDLRQVDWNFVHQLFGETMQSSTNEEDLWLALQESIALCDDASLIISRGSGAGMARGKRLPEGCLEYRHTYMQLVEKKHLTEGGRKVSNNFIFGLLNAETSPGWRIGYIALNSMEGFVDFPIPRLDSLVITNNNNNEKSSNDLVTTNSRSTTHEVKSSVIVPEIYDLESMRWALEAILQSMGELDGLILDLRFNQGGGTLAASLAVASFLTTAGKKTFAFSTDEKISGINPKINFAKQKNHYIPSLYKSSRYGGPLVVLQSPYTRGTAEVLNLALMSRPNTCRIGTATAGNLSQTRKLRLPNYWTVEIPYQRCFSYEGKLYEGVGIPPHKEVKLENTNELDSPSLTVAATTSLSPSITQTQEIFDPWIKMAVDHIMHV